MNSYNFMKTKKKIVREMMVWDTVYDDDDDDHIPFVGRCQGTSQE